MHVWMELEQTLGQLNQHAVRYIEDYGSVQEAAGQPGVTVMQLETGDAGAAVAVG